MSIVHLNNAISEIFSIVPVEVWFALAELVDGLGFLSFGHTSLAKAVDELLELIKISHENVGVGSRFGLMMFD